MSLETKRMALLIRQAREFLSAKNAAEGLTKKASQDDTAEYLGIKQAFLSKVLNGSSQAGEKTMRAVREKVGLQSRFFTDKALGETPSYRDFLGDQSLAGSPPAPATAPRAAAANGPDSSDIDTLGRFLVKNDVTATEKAFLIESATDDPDRGDLSERDFRRLLGAHRRLRAAGDHRTATDGESGTRRKKPAQDAPVEVAPGTYLKPGRGSGSQ